MTRIHDIGRIGDTAGGQHLLKRHQPGTVIIIAAVKASCMRVTGKRTAERIGPVRPSKQPAVMKMDSNGKGGGVPRLVERAAWHRPVGLCGCRSGHAGTR